VPLPGGASSLARATFLRTHIADVPKTGPDGSSGLVNEHAHVEASHGMSSHP
jgi:hypothetical protein